MSAPCRDQTIPEVIWRGIKHTMQPLDSNRFRNLRFTTRAASDDELRNLEHSQRISVGGVLYLLFVVAVLNGILAGTVAFAFALLAGGAAGDWIRRIVPALIFLLSLFLLRGLTVSYRNTRRRIEQDIRSSQITVASGDVQQWYYSHGSLGKSSFEQRREFPVLIGDLGDGERLLMTGEQLFEPGTYGYCPTENDSDMPRSSFNGLPSPAAFPTSSLVIEYWPNCGELVAINPQGEMVDPQDVIIHSLHRVGWQGQTVMPFHGDPGLRDASTSESIELISDSAAGS